jgi:hypothetical protein
MIKRDNFGRFIKGIHPETEFRVGHLSGMFGKTHSEDTKQKIREKKSGTHWGHHSEESKTKIGLTHKGKIISEYQKEKIRDANRGNKYNWKGDKVGYRGLHKWITKQLGKAKECKRCGIKKIPEGKKRFFQWANLDHKYSRDIKDWEQMCIDCHSFYDKTYL